jgi:YD repeat-containing protein
MQQLTSVKYIPLVLFPLLFGSCQDAPPETTQVGEDTFVHGDHVYRIIGSEIMEVGNLKKDTIAQSSVLKPSREDYGTYELDYVKEGATADLEAIYRGDKLYFKLEIEGMADLISESRNALGSSGGVNIKFLDNEGFQIHRVPIKVNELTRILTRDGTVSHYEYNGKARMSSEIYRAIYTFSVSSSLD